MAQSRHARIEARRQEVIAALREAADRVGPDISIARFYRETGITDRKVYQLFDNWADLRIQAGLPAEVNRSQARHTKEDILARLKEVAAEIGEDISSTEFINRTGITFHFINRWFGTWTKLKREAGLNAPRRYGERPRFTADELREKLQERIAQKGDVTLDTFCRELGVSTAALRQAGGWTELRRSLNLPIRARNGRQLWQTETQFPPVPGFPDFLPGDVASPAGFGPDPFANATLEDLARYGRSCHSRGH